MDRRNAAWLPPIAFGTILVFFFVWAAMHDLAHGDEGTLERIVLAFSAVAFSLLYRQALRVLPSKAKLAWLIGAGLLIVLYSAGAVSAVISPKYPRDPILGSVFLAAGAPALGLIGYHILRERRVRNAS